MDAIQTELNGKTAKEKGENRRWIKRRVKSALPSHFAYSARTSKAAVEIVWNESGLRVERSKKKQRAGLARAIVPGRSMRAAKRANMLGNRDVSRS